MDSGLPAGLKAFYVFIFQLFCKEAEQYDCIVCIQNRKIEKER